MTTRPKNVKPAWVGRSCETCGSQVLQIELHEKNLQGTHTSRVLLPGSGASRKLQARKRQAASRKRPETEHN